MSPRPNRWRTGLLIAIAAVLAVGVGVVAVRARKGPLDTATPTFVHDEPAGVGWMMAAKPTETATPAAAGGRITRRTYVAKAGGHATTVAVYDLNGGTFDLRRSLHGAADGLGCTLIHETSPEISGHEARRADFEACSAGGHGTTELVELDDDHVLGVFTITKSDIDEHAVVDAIVDTLVFD